MFGLKRLPKGGFVDVFNPFEPIGTKDLLQPGYVYAPYIPLQITPAIQFTLKFTKFDHGDFLIAMSNLDYFEDQFIGFHQIVRVAEWNNESQAVSIQGMEWTKYEGKMVRAFYPALDFRKATPVDIIKSRLENQEEK